MPVPNEDAPQESIARLLHDSAVVLASLTGLLYLTSYLYGISYLSVFGIELGFGGVGLGNLAMFRIEGCFMVVFSINALYLTVSRVRTFEFIVGAVAYAALVCSGQLTDLAYGRPIEKAWPTLAFLAIASVAAIVLHRRLGVLIPKFDQQIERAEAIVKKSGPLNKAEVREAEDIITSSRHHRRRAQLRIAFFCAIVTITTTLPAVAKWQAIGAAQQETWKRLDAAGKPRVPVYWVGDRFVYVTFEGGCYVHVQIADTEQARRECPKLIIDVTLP